MNSAKRGGSVTVLGRGESRRRTPAVIRLGLASPSVKISVELVNYWPEH